MERLLVVKSPSGFTPISYRPKDAAKVLGFGHSHFAKLLASGKIASRTDGRARLIDHEALVAYRNSLPVFVPDQIPIGSLLPVDEQKIALERANGAGTPVSPPAPPSPPPPLASRPPDIDLAAIYEGKRKLLAPDLGSDKARDRAFEFTARACARHFTVSLEEAEERTRTALEEHGRRESRISPAQRGRFERQWGYHVTAVPKHRFLISALIPSGVAHGFLACRDRPHEHRVGW